MLIYRKKNEQLSWHDLLRVVDADEEWCKSFAKKCIVNGEHHIDGLEVFYKSKSFVMNGKYNIKNTDKMAEWIWLDDSKDKKIIDIKKDEILELFPKKMTEKIIP